MAETYSRMMQATRIIRTQGVMGHDPDKGKHPAIAVVEESSRNLRGFMASFGILPADEARLGLKKSKESAANPFAEPQVG
jgi:P27 family predicted phage terminase small subunit